MKTIIFFAGVLTLTLLGTVKSSSAIDKNSLYRIVLVQEKDQALEIEDWMTNDNYWNFTVKEVQSVTEEQDAEQSIEDWMVDETIWSETEETTITNVEEEDSMIDIEPWMINKSYWD